MILKNSFRTLTPAGEFISPFKVLKELYNLKKKYNKNFNTKCIKDEVSNFLASFINAKNLYFTSSGTEAIFQILKAFKDLHTNPTLYLASYTCPQIISAALKANFNCHILDINKNTLEIEYKDINPQKDSILLLSNLYGLPDSLTADLKNSFSLIIDDASQSLRTKRENENVGTSSDTIGISSFSRAKSISALGGGVIIENSYSDSKKELYKNIFNKISLNLNSLKKEETYLKNLILFLKGFIYYTFSSPYLYKIPNSIPFLNLGKTLIDLDFKVSSIKTFELLTLYLSLKEFNNQSYTIKNAKKWKEVFKEIDLISPLEKRNLNLSNITLTRYPLIIKDKKRREEIYKIFKENGLGITLSYPLSLKDYKEFNNHPKIKTETTKGSDYIKDRIITLPVHSKVKEIDIKKGKVKIEERRK